MARGALTLEATEPAGSDSTLNDLVRAGALLSRDFDLRTLMSVLVEQSLDVTKSDLSCLFMLKDLDDAASDLRLVYRRGKHQVASRLGADSELIDFIRESGEAVVCLERAGSPFADLLLDHGMESGVALPLVTPRAPLGVLFVNSRTPL